MKPDAMVVQMLPTATELVILVRDREREQIADLIEGMGVQDLRTLSVLLAAMVPAHARLGDLLAWVDDPTATELKTCVHCGEDKPRSAFTVDKSKPDGRRGSCRECNAAKRRAAVAA